MLLNHTNIEINKRTIDTRLVAYAMMDDSTDWHWLLNGLHVTMSMPSSDAKAKGILANPPKKKLGGQLEGSAYAKMKKRSGSIYARGQSLVNGLFDKGDRKVVKCVDSSQKWFQSTAFRDTGRWFPIQAVEHYNDSAYFIKHCPGESALTLACREGFHELIKLLTTNGAKHALEGCVTTVWATCDAGRDDVLKDVLMKDYPEVVQRDLNITRTSNNMTPLVASCVRSKPIINGHSKVSEILIAQDNINIHEQCTIEDNGQKLTALIAASKVGNKSIVDAILSKLGGKGATGEQEKQKIQILAAKDVKNRTALSTCKIAASKWSNYFSNNNQNADRKSIIESIKQKVSTINNQILYQQIISESDSLLEENEAKRKAIDEKESAEMEVALANLDKEVENELLKQVDAMGIPDEGEGEVSEVEE